MSCGGCRNSISADKLTGAVKSFEDCMAECDRMEARYLTEYLQCSEQCFTEAQPKIDLCAETIPPGPQQGECRQQQIAKRNECLLACATVWETHLAEIKKCRADCINRISILTK
jgi:hypothetical protein